MDAVENRATNTLFDPLLMSLLMSHVQKIGYKLFPNPHPQI
jgi:hypothetical protein